MNRRKHPGYIPFLLLIVILIPLALAKGDQRALVVGGASYIFFLAIWFATQKLSSNQIFMGMIGGVLGLSCAYFAQPAFHIFAASSFSFAVMKLIVTFGAFILGAGLGISVEDLVGGAETQNSTSSNSGYQKVCDTSVLIDGRITDMAAAGFVDGELIIPQFVLQELQAIADSSDQLKRNRGRRGLDIVKELQEGGGVLVTIVDTDYRDESEVDHKLILLAEELGADLITNDFNLNKVARVRDIKVLNLNDLINALKTIYLPGEQITVCVSKEGKEDGQGVGYLEDGTMIVIDEGGNYPGRNVLATVTNVHQTTAGRMIFTKFDGFPDKKNKSNN